MGDVSNKQTWLTEYGMTLLDYFAAKALPALIEIKGNSTHQYSRNIEGTCDDVAAAAYSIAAAMLTERERHITP